MATGPAHSSISFDALVAASAGLSLADKQRLLDVLEERVGQAEEDAWEHDPVASAEMQQARDEYAAGDFVTFDERPADHRDTITPSS